MSRILVLNGPNLNLLGSREPDIYGGTTLTEIEASLQALSLELGHSLEFRQSNHEGELVEAVQGAAELFDGMIVNLGAYTHTSLALRDAFLAVQTPFVEVHLSNIFKREVARHHSVIADQAIGMITGFGAIGYSMALRALTDSLAND